MSDDDPLDRALDAFADGEEIEWERLADAASSTADIQRLKHLRMFAKIRELHGAEPSTTMASTALPPLAGPITTPSAIYRWGRYELLEEVGAGSFGRVYRARDPNLDRIVAVKILHRSTADTRIRERLLSEGKQLAKLRDPNVVSVFDVSEHDGQLGLCMEFVHGETLDEVLLSRGTLNHREATLVAQDVCRALAAAHAAGVLHRDVKARNIMRDRAGRIVLMDFGAGREVEEIERSAPAASLAGTPLYMAPEVLAGNRASFGSDLYSVGVLLYYLVTGNYPVSGRTLKDIRTAHMSGLRVPISHRRTNLPPAFVRIVDKALAANPEQRYRSAPEMLDDLGFANVQDIRPTKSNVLVRIGVAVVGAVFCLAMVGLITTQYAISILGSSAYREASVSLWLQWGAKSLYFPAFLLGWALVVSALIGVCARLVANVYPGVRGVQQRLKTWVHRRNLDDADYLAAAGLLMSILILAATYLRFSDLLYALGLGIYPDVSHAAVQHLRRLSPAFAGEHNSYRLTLTFVVFACLALWRLPLHVAAKRQQQVSRVVSGAGAAVTMIAVFLLSFPYVLLTENLNEFVVAMARWNGARCYVLGERPEDSLLFCPAREPRLVVVRAGEAQRTEERPDNPFTYFATTETR